MMKPEYTGNDWAIYNGDNIEVMAGLPEDSIDCAIFSPPFADLFVYSDSERDMGNCASKDEFFEHYRYFCENLYRIIKPGRTIAVHCTDLPMRKGRDGHVGLQDFSGDLIKAHSDAGFVYHARCTIWKDPVVEMQRTKAVGLLYKQLRKDSSMSRVGMPDYMLFFRKDEPATDPVRHFANNEQETVQAYEFAKDRLGIDQSGRVERACDELIIPVEEWQELASPVWMTIDQTKVLNGRMAKGEEDEKHICPLQLDVIERCLKLYTNPGDVVLDPFNGIGSTGYEAVKRDRKYVGIELKPEYAKQADKFMKEAEQSKFDLFSQYA